RVPGRAFHHWRDQEHEPGTVQDRAGTAPLADADRARRAAAGRAARDHHRDAHRLFRDLTRHPDRGAVRFRPGPRLHPASRHGGAQGARHYGPAAVAVLVRDPRQCAASLRRAPRALAMSVRAEILRLGLRWSKRRAAPEPDIAAMRARLDAVKWIIPNPPRG